MIIVKQIKNEIGHIATFINKITIELMAHRSIVLIAACLPKRLIFFPKMQNTIPKIISVNGNKGRFPCKIKGKEIAIPLST